MNLRKKPNKREKILFAVMLAVVGLTGFKLLVWNDFQAIQITKAQIAMVTPQYQIVHSQNSVLPKKWVGTNGDVQDALETILDSAHTGELKITKSEFSSVKTDDGKQKREVNLVVLGSYAALERYLHHLENMPAPVVIQTFSLQRSAADSDELTLEVSGAIYGAN